MAEDKAKEPKDNTHPVPPQKPELPDGAKYDEAEGGVPENSRVSVRDGQMTIGRWILEI